MATALGFAHDDGMAIKVDVFHSQRQRLVTTHACAIQQLGQ